MYCNNGQQKIENTAFNLGFLCVCSRREDFVRLLRSSVFFSALMVNGKFVLCCSNFRVDKSDAG
jgi:hypothetical protein